MDNQKRGVLHWAANAFNATMNFVVRRAFPERPYEVRYALAGALLGSPGFLLGGAGIATHGNAIGVSIGMISTALLALVGSRAGIERDLRALRRRRETLP